MARGNEIIINTNPLGLFQEGPIGTGLTPKPGTAMQLKPATALVGGRWTFELYNVAADGSRPTGPIFILLEDNLQGRTCSDAYAAGDWARCYVPLPGDEINLLIANIAGTGDDHAKGEVLIIDDGTGLFIATTGSPETEVAVLLETITDPTADTLAWCQWTGH